jgi:hypothetical protein
MDAEPHSIDEQLVDATSGKPNWPEEEESFVEDITGGIKHPVEVPSVPSGSEVQAGWRRRDYLWPEVHDPYDTPLKDVDPRASGDPVGLKRKPGARP